jgi:hypothetical protein
MVAFGHAYGYSRKSGSREDPNDPIALAIAKLFPITPPLLHSLDSSCGEGDTIFEVEEQCRRQFFGEHVGEFGKKVTIGELYVMHVFRARVMGMASVHVDTASACEARWVL